MSLKKKKTNISRKNVTYLQLKILTGRRQASWLFTKRDRRFELGTTEKQIPLGRDYNTSALKHSASLPPSGRKCVPESTDKIRYSSIVSLAQNRTFSNIMAQAQQDVDNSRYLAGATRQQLTIESYQVYTCCLCASEKQKPFVIGQISVGVVVFSRSPTRAWKSEHFKGFRFCDRWGKLHNESGCKKRLDCILCNHSLP